ncbi:MAG TPA: BT_3928 family protein [Chitinophagaceae bacterium]
MTKSFINITRWLVGLLFIFSGLVKANDPLGLSYKMQEFFDLWQTSFLNDYSLTFSIIIIAFEIIAGVALLLGWQMKLFSWLLLLLIVFFTFLTGFAYLSGKFKNCGCFGDCLPITPLASFIKDLALLGMIGFLFYHRERIKPLFSKSISISLIILSAVLSLGFQWYVLKYLPLVDCLPFKTENNISEKMKIPANAIPDSFAIVFVYEKNGKQFDFSPAELPTDLDSYTFVERKDKLVRQGNAEPAIKGFSLNTLTDADSTEAILQSAGYSILFFINDHTKNEVLHLKGGPLEKAFNLAKQKNIPAYAVSNTGENIKAQFEEMGWEIPVLKIDFTAFRTAARANPVIYLIKKGTVINKWPQAETEDFINTIEKL